MDAELVLERDAGARRCAAPSVPSAPTRNFGTMNSEMPARARRRVRQAGQHEVDDVLGQVVLAVGDEDLLADDAVAVAVRHRPASGARRQVRARLRLGQVHRPRPLARDHPRQEHPLERVGAVVLERLDRALGQHLAEREGEVG